MRHPVILAGGAGTRLWPASRRARPKQFLTIGGDASLLGATVRRARAAATGGVMVVTAIDQAAQASREVGAGTEIVAEPAPRNTAAAIGLAAVHLLARDPDAVMGVLPADHHIGDEAAWARTVERGFAAAERDVMCTVGIVPDHAETGYGYLELGESREAALGVPGVRAVARFVEKPDLATAQRYLAGGQHLWNAGMVFVRARRLLAELAAHMPETAAGLDAVARALRESPEAAAAEAARVYPGLPSVSIDHGVMEKADGVVTVPGDFGWNDIGSWAAVADVRGGGGTANALVGDAVVVDGSGNLVMADDGHAVVVVGCSDLVVVQAGDAVLVIPRERAQDVRLAVEALRARGLHRYL